MSGFPIYSPSSSGIVGCGTAGASEVIARARLAMRARMRARVGGSVAAATAARGERTTRDGAKRDDGLKSVNRR